MIISNSSFVHTTRKTDNSTTIRKISKVTITKKVYPSAMLKKKSIVVSMNKISF